VICGRAKECFLAITAPCAANTLSDFCKEPSPRGRGGKMLEETPLEYALLSLCSNECSAVHRLGPD
jgi:hypothetical protein